MTARPTLAETIALLDLWLDDEPCGVGPPRDETIGKRIRPHLRALRDCARRCEAIEAAKDRPKPYHTMRLGPLDGPKTNHEMYVAKDLDPYIDQLLAERDALAKRVGELTEELRVEKSAADVGQSFRDLVVKERDFERLRVDRLTAESTRLRAVERQLRDDYADQHRRTLHALDERDRLRTENERLTGTQDVMARYAAACKSDLTAAQDRVRELEEALSATVRALHEHGHKQEASTYYRYLPPLDTSNQPGPIPGPTQGVVTTKGNDK